MINSLLGTSQISTLFFFQILRYDLGGAIEG